MLNYTFLKAYEYTDHACHAINIAQRREMFSENNMFLKKWNGMFAYRIWVYFVHIGNRVIYSILIPVKRYIYINRIIQGVESKPHTEVR